MAFNGRVGRGKEQVCFFQPQWGSRVYTQMCSSVGKRYHTFCGLTIHLPKKPLGDSQRLEDISLPSEFFLSSLLFWKQKGEHCE